MLTDTVRTMYGYNRWATDRMLDAAAKLTPEQLHTPGHAGHGSVLNTLIHLVDVQRSWLSWWDGSLSAAEATQFRLDWPPRPDLDRVRAEWEALDQETQAFVSTLTDADLARVYEETAPDGTKMQLVLWEMMVHVANHGTQHRSEIAAMLTEFGHSPGEVDLLFYLLAQHHVPAG